MAAAELTAPAQVVVEQGMRRHLISRALLHSGCHRLGFLRPFLLPRRPTPVRYVAQS
uniref:Zinc finger protein 256 n=2 Tax=Macaca TaxID=9539 RepID=A0A7N9IA31_MACFA